jgi:RimJ/RimL family protein N-acetyltransferase
MRGFKPADLDAYAEMMADPDVTRYISDRSPLTRSEAWRQMAIFTGHWTLRGYGIWVVEERSTGEFLGRIGFWDPEGWPGFELAYSLKKPAWGKGLASEGARAALSFAYNTLGRTEIISLIRPENVASIRVAEALGATCTETIELLGFPALKYRHLSSPPPANR